MSWRVQVYPKGTVALFSGQRGASTVVSRPKNPQTPEDFERYLNLLPPNVTPPPIEIQNEFLAKVAQQKPPNPIEDILEEPIQRKALPMPIIQKPTFHQVLQNKLPVPIFKQRPKTPPPGLPEPIIPDYDYLTGKEQIADFKAWKESHENKNKTIYLAYKEAYEHIQTHSNFSYQMNSSKEGLEKLEGLILAAKEKHYGLQDYNLILTLHTRQLDRTHFRLLNMNTIENFIQMLENEEYVHDSEDVNIVDDIKDLKELDITFLPRRHRVGYYPDEGGVFPFINKLSEIDLSKFGIFNNLNDSRIKESCLYLAFKESNLFSEDELKLLLSTIRTRYVKVDDLKIIGEILNVHIRLKILKDSKSVIKKEFNVSGTRKIRLWLIFNHFLLNEVVPNISLCYIQNYQEIQKHRSLSTNPRRTILKTFSPNRYTFYKSDFPGTKIGPLIRSLYENHFLEQINYNYLYNLHWSFTQSKDYSFNFSILMNIKSRYNYKKEINYNTYGESFFGYKIKIEDVPKRLNELQEVIDSLDLRKHICVINYHRYSDLMQKIMFEYGCYEGVYKISGELANKIRSQCVFPKTRTFNDKPLYLNQKLYYLDINGAYMAMIKHIPTGTDLLTPTTFNSRIRELIETLYKIRKSSNSELGTTIKFLMNSCYGYSIKRPKQTKVKWLEDNETVDYDDTYLLAYDNNTYTTVNSVVSSFTVPHFAREILNEFKRFMDEIKSIVQVYYENIDAILISESDYFKLKELNYLGSELGKFKIEHIFTEIAILSPKKYIAKLEDGTYFYHMVSKEVDPEYFISLVKSK